MGPFLKHSHDISLHILVLLILKPADRQNHMEKVLSAGVDVDSRWKKSRWAPLHIAAQEGDREVVLLLLMHEAKKNRQDVHGRLHRDYAVPEVATLLELGSVEKNPNR